MKGWFCEGVFDDAKEGEGLCESGIREGNGLIRECDVCESCTAGVVFSFIDSEIGVVVAVPAAPRFEIITHLGSIGIKRWAIFDCSGWSEVW